MWHQRILNLDASNGQVDEVDIDDMEIPEECNQAQNGAVQNEYDEKRQATIEVPGSLINSNDLKKAPADRCKHKGDDDEEHKFSTHQFGQVYSVFGFKSAVRK